MLLRHVFLMAALFIASGIANKIAGKWQLLFYYEVYRYQADALGIANSEMAVDCSKDGNPCDLKSFVKKVCVVNPKDPIRGPDGNVIKPVQFTTTPDFDSVDWNGIGEGNTLNQDKFATEMDRVKFHGLMINSVLFKGWSGGVSFNLAMGEAERIALKAQAQLTKNGQPVSNDRYLALQKALEIHGNARRLDQATRLLDNFDKWNKQRNYEIHLGEEISRPPVPPYRKLDSEAMVTANGLVGGKADLLRDWVATENAAGKSQMHVGPIIKSTEIQHKLAEACNKK